MSSREFQTHLDQGLAHFRGGRFREAHEAWETGWRATRAAEKQLLQVLILWATALHHAGNANRTGAVTLMRRALERLEAPAIHRAPFEVQPLRDALVQSWETVSKEGPFVLEPPDWSPVPVTAEPETDAVELTQRTGCPYCGEPVAVEIDPALAGGAEYVEDCPVCCRPWTVQIRDDAGQLAVQLRRGDE